MLGETNLILTLSPLMDLRRIITRRNLIARTPYCSKEVIMRRERVILITLRSLLNGLELLNDHVITVPRAVTLLIDLDRGVRSMLITRVVPTEVV